MAHDRQILPNEPKSKCKDNTNTYMCQRLKECDNKDVKSNKTNQYIVFKSANSKIVVHLRLLKMKSNNIVTEFF